MLKNLQKKKIIFIYDLFNAKNELKTWDEIKVTNELSDNSISNGDKLSIHFPKLGKKYSTQRKSK